MASKNIPQDPTQDPNQSQPHQAPQPRAGRRDEVGANRDANDRENKRGVDESEWGEPHSGDIKYFEGSITKVNKDGATVMSDHLAEGERLRRETTDRFKASDLTADQK